jgi:hypothetical protein
MKGLGTEAYRGERRRSSDAYTVFQPELLRDEEILWTGQPKVKVFALADILLIPFSFLWCVIVFVFAAAAFFSGEVIVILFAAVFLILGLFVLIGRFIWKIKRRRNTFYAVTNKRVLVFTDVWTKDVQAVFIESIPVINRLIRSNGSGTIKFGNMSFLGSLNESTGMDFLLPPYGREVPVFYDIKDARKVYDTVTVLRDRLLDKT